MDNFNDAEIVESYKVGAVVVTVYRLAAAPDKTLCVRVEAQNELIFEFGMIDQNEQCKGYIVFADQPDVTSINVQ